MARNLKGKKQLKKRSTAYMTRSEAIQKLQLSLKDFRRLCILKGVYPVEVKKKNVHSNSSQTKTYYLRKDILYLSHEPIIWRFWDFKIFMKRMAKAKGRRDKEWVQRIRENKPFYKLDHIVKERYPTLIDALRDLDDALSMCFLYAMFGKSKVLPLELIELSRRLTLEFMYYVMETKSLRKCFISIKGYYYEANIMGQTIRWVVPHQFVMNRVPDVDFQVMKTFTEFYVTLLGFVIYKLYTSNSYVYPPQFSENKIKNGEENSDDNENEDNERDETLVALNYPLINRSDSGKFDDQAKIDHFESELGNDDEEIRFGSSVMTFHQLQKLQNLFAGLKFFINREVPREALCFVIRSFSGEVSWDRNLFAGATFDENDEQITHQIVDREIPKTHINRYYIQPQWVFDSVNSRKLLPVQNYFMGAKLPPHLSPFVDEKPGEYVPPDVQMIQNNQSYDDNDLNDEDDDEDIDEEMVDDEEKTNEIDANNNDNKEDQQEEEMMMVKKGKRLEIDTAKQMKQKQDEEKRLRVLMMPKKRKKLYDLIMKNKKKQTREYERLQQKRMKYDQQQQQQKKRKQQNRSLNQRKKLKQK